MGEPLLINSNFIEEHTSFSKLVSALKTAFSSNETIVPDRHHHDFPNPKVKQDTTLLLMPAWSPSEDAGIKVVTVNPGNDKFELPSIQGSYLYLDATTGVLKAIVEAKGLTAKRTAATSALASSFLSKPDSESLLMIGTGALSSNLIKAHATVRPIKRVYVWGRDFEKAKEIAKQVENDKLGAEAISSIESVISEVDIISCATLSKKPLIFGEHLRKGQHIDLVGAYKPDMREADDEAIKKSSIFLDSYEGGLKESGDIVIPLTKGLIQKNDIRADLFELCSNRKKGRISKNEITVFKSVGHALEDLVAARYFYNQYINKEDV